ncbi:MAG: hypothetical protein FJW40_13155 [Acidobacteria bacterium]|nr:hypothetical protein [Acidobacteriota bacterium]
MPGDFDFSFPDPGSLKRGRFTYLPVAPGRLEFAAEVRKTILATRPHIVAVELPLFLERRYLNAIERLPQISMLVYPEHTDSAAGEDERAVYVTVEPADPFTEAIRTAHEIGAQVLFIDPAVGEHPHLPDDYPDPYALRRIPFDKYIEAYRVHPQQRNQQIERHAAGLAWKLQGADPLATILVVVALNLLDPLLDAMEVPQQNPHRTRLAPPVDLLNPHPDCLGEITIEYPALQARYEEWRVLLSESALIDRPAAQWAVLREAETSFEKNTGGVIAPWQRRLIARYTRNLAHVHGYLAANLFEMTVAARGIADDNYGWEVWEAASRYRWQQVTTFPETASISAGEVWLNTRHIRLRRRLPRPKQRLQPANLKKRPKERTPGEWAKQLDGDSICSYPPEDLVVENYGRFVKKKAHSVLSDERTRTEPFTTSILDGLDIRETIRNWHRNKLFVRHMDRVAGDVGSVVVIFDEDPDGRYTYQTTWLGEHQNESDMAFYSTPPFDHMVGPGIGRAEYGGFLMSLPPRRMFDVWGDTDYSFTESKSERLLAAAIDYSVERYVVYVAAKPPRSTFRSIAARCGRSILYIPIGQLSKEKLNKVRVVHVLDNHQRRRDAAQYIW